MRRLSVSFSDLSTELLARGKFHLLGAIQRCEPLLACCSAAQLTSRLLATGCFAHKQLPIGIPTYLLRRF
jgi:hypothetical protein